jgi:hypothetical protein
MLGEELVDSAYLHPDQLTLQVVGAPSASDDPYVCFRNDWSRRVRVPASPRSLVAQRGPTSKFFGGSPASKE